MAGLVPAISLMDAPRTPERDRRAKPGDDRLRSACLEKIFQQCGAIALTDTAIDFGPVMACRRSKESNTVFNRTALRIGRAEVKPPDAGE